MIIRRLRCQTWNIKYKYMSRCFKFSPKSENETNKFLVVIINHIQGAQLPWNALTGQYQLNVSYVTEVLTVIIDRNVSNGPRKVLYGDF